MALAPVAAAWALASPDLVARASADPLPAVKVFAQGAFRPGEWALRRAGRPADRRLCVLTPERMARAGYFENQDCTYTLLENDADRATVSYRCEGGWGLTEIRRDARDLYTIDAQGLRDGQPFARRAELSRTGDCKEAATR